MDLDCTIPRICCPALGIGDLTKASKQDWRNVQRYGVRRPHFRRTEYMYILYPEIEVSLSQGMTLQLTSVSIYVESTRRRLPTV